MCVSVRPRAIPNECCAQSAENVWWKMQLLRVTYHTRTFAAAVAQWTAVNASNVSSVGVDTITLDTGDATIAW